MKERWRITLLVGIMVLVLFVVVAVSFTMLYRAAMTDERARLSTGASEFARHITNMARVEGILPTDGTRAIDPAKLDVLLQGHGAYRPKKKTGEIVVARLQGDTMIFLLREDITETGMPKELPFSSPLGEPMRRALSGMSGTMIGIDYRGVTVLSAYEPVAELGLGVVSKIDLPEVQAAFVRAGTTAAIIAILLALAGSLAFLRISKPMIRHLDESEERFRMLVESAPDAIFVQTDYRFAYVNPAAVRLYGAASADELLGQPVMERFHPDYHALVADRIRALNIDRKSVPNIEQRHFRMDGSIVDVSVSGSPVHYGGKDGALVFVRDVTERKRGELALRESEARLRLAYSSAKAGAWEWDLRTNKNTWSDELWDLYGIEPYSAEASYDLWKQSIFPEDRQAVETAVRQAAGSGTELYAEWRVNDPKGPQRWLMSRGQPQRDEKGQVARYLGVVVDISEGKRAEAALQKSAAFLDSIIDQSPVPTWISDKKGTLIRINQACCDLLHITPEQVMGRYNVLEDNIVEEQGFLPQVKAVFKKGQTARFELRYDTAKVTGLDLNGTASVYLDVTIFPVRDPAGKITNAVIQHKDITERKRAEEALRTNEAFTKAVLDNLPVGVAVNSVDPTVAFDYMNDNFTKFYRTTREKLAEPDGFWAAVYEDPEFRKKIQERVLDDCATGDPDRMFWADIPITREGQETHYITARNIPVPDKPLMILTVWDITEQKRAEEALRQSEVKYRTVADYNYDWEYWVGPDGRIIYMSPACERITGYRADEFIEKPELLKSIIHPDDRQKHARHEAESDSKQTGQLDFRIITRDGHERWIAHACLTAFGDDGSPLGRRANNRDITERKQAEDEIKKLNEELEQRVADRTAQLAAVNKELEAFSYSVSHDLRSPLRAIDGFTRVLVEEYDRTLDDEGRRLTGVIRENTARMGKLIDDLLAFSRVGRSEMHVGPVNMELAARSAFFELTTEEDRARVDFSVDSLPQADGDDAMLRQVWTNLIANALKFSSKKERAVIEVSGRMDGPEVIYSVKDNGAGFDMKYSDKLFGVFQRLHGEREFPGTGVGLAIVQRVVTRHGGRVWARGEVGAGAEFSFSVPKRGGAS